MDSGIMGFSTLEYSLSYIRQELIHFFRRSVIQEPRGAFNFQMGANGLRPGMEHFTEDDHPQLIILEPVLITRCLTTLAQYPVMADEPEGFLTKTQRVLNVRQEIQIHGTLEQLS